VTPSTTNKITPGIKKLEKGEFDSIDSGMPRASPNGEMINTPPPKMAPIPSRDNNNK
jgi:hypothetical protein